MINPNEEPRKVLNNCCYLIIIQTLNCTFNNLACNKTQMCSHSHPELQRSIGGDQSCHQTSAAWSSDRRITRISPDTPRDTRAQVRHMTLVSLVCVCVCVFPPFRSAISTEQHKLFRRHTSARGLALFSQLYHREVPQGPRRHSTEKTRVLGRRRPAEEQPIHTSVKTNTMGFIFHHCLFTTASTSPSLFPPWRSRGMFMSVPRRAVDLWVTFSNPPRTSLR